MSGVRFPPWPPFRTRACEKSQALFLSRSFASPYSVPTPPNFAHCCAFTRPGFGQVTNNAIAANVISISECFVGCRGGQRRRQHTFERFHVRQDESSSARFLAFGCSSILPDKVCPDHRAQVGTGRDAVTRAVACVPTIPTVPTEKYKGRVRGEGAAGLCVPTCHASGIGVARDTQSAIAVGTSGQPVDCAGRSSSSHSANARRNSSRSCP